MPQLRRRTMHGSLRLERERQEIEAAREEAQAQEGQRAEGKGAERQTEEGQKEEEKEVADHPAVYSETIKRAVVPEREAKSISHETTFEQDIDDQEVLRAWLLDLTEQVAWRLRSILNREPHRDGVQGDLARHR